MGAEWVLWVADGCRVVEMFFSGSHSIVRDIDQIAVPLFPRCRNLVTSILLKIKYILSGLKSSWLFLGLGQKVHSIVAPNPAIVNLPDKHTRTQWTVGVGLFFALRLLREDSRVCYF